MDATIVSEFATAAFRVGHTEIPDNFTYMDYDRIGSTVTHLEDVSEVLEIGMWNFRCTLLCILQHMNVISCLYHVYSAHLIAIHFRRVHNGLFGRMFILVAALPCLQLLPNRTKIFFETFIFTRNMFVNL